MSKELEALERIKNAPISYEEETPRFTHTYLQDLYIVEQSIKALEVITSRLGTAQIKDKYIMFFGEDEEPLTKEEYDLIQEILL